MCHSLSYRLSIALTCHGLLFAAPARSQTPTNDFQYYLLAPLKVHLLTAKNLPLIQTSLTQTDFDRILAKINLIWAQAGLHFYIQSIGQEEVNEPEKWANHGPPPEGINLLQLRPLGSLATNAFHIYYLKKMSVNGIYFPEGIFVKDTAALRDVEGGIDEPLPRVSSHELGHALGLSHRQNTTNLMASGTTGTWLNGEEINQARNAARKLDWILPAPELIKTANTLFQRGKFSEAKTFYLRAAMLPLKADEVEVAKKRLAEITHKGELNGNDY